MRTDVKTANGANDDEPKNLDSMEADGAIN